MATVSPILDVWVGNTYYKVRTDRQGMTEAGVSVRYFVKRTLVQTEFDWNLRCWIPVHNYSIHSDLTGEAYFPRYTLDEFIAEVSPRAEVKLHTLPPVKSRDIHIGLKSSFTPREHQLPIIEFLTNPDASYKPLSAACGTGKTASTIAAIAKLKGPAIIILGMLIDQWYKELFNFTTLKKEDVVIIQGYESIKSLWAKLEAGYQPKVVIFSTRTLTFYCERKNQYADIPSYQDLLAKIGVRTKVFDECHTNFLANTRIDLCTNVEHNIYLSATYARSDKSGKAIFNRIYPIEMRYGEGDVKKYTKVYGISYTLGLTQEDGDSFKVAKGYLHALYESSLVRLKKHRLVPYVKILSQVIYTYWYKLRKPGQKLLILCRTQKLVLALTKRISKRYPNCKVEAYFSGNATMGSRAILDKADIIISTMNSASTGVDIKNLKTCINTVSFASEPLAAQTLGRLRELPGDETIFVDFYNSDVISHRYHYQARKSVYATKAASIEEVYLD